MDDKITGSVKALHVISSGWVLGLAGVIFVDVVGRGLFNMPLLGTAEIVKNSIVAITFLQLPLAINVGAMLRTSALLDFLGPKKSFILELLACLLGIAFFVALVLGSWHPFWEAWEIGEYEGEGALRVPTYPVRAIIVIMGAVSALIYARQIVRLLKGEPQYE